ncbi:MAG TPA: hypothetical protein VHL11_23445 [Phototrophicaceae bacterium]|jgi:hypothetical protein|nr:hypothetical protein [Phototrophicaceae bacterium]
MPGLFAVGFWLLANGWRQSGAKSDGLTFSSVASNQRLAVIDIVIAGLYIVHFSGNFDHDNPNN